MIISRRLQVSSLLGLAALTMAANAGSSTITFNTNAATTGFGGSGALTLNSSGGALATLAFVPDGNLTVGTPSNVNFGSFTLGCPACSTQALGAGALFAPFSFDLVVTDLTDNAIGTFSGSSVGGTIFSDTSPLSILWSTLQLGPNGDNASSGNFGSTYFSGSALTRIVAPTSGAIAGQTTLQGFVGTAATDPSVPAPNSFWLMGLAGFGLMLVRKRSVGQKALIPVSSRPIVS